MSRTLYLARHGETGWNRLGRWQGHTDVALSDVGRSQAAALAERLRELGIDRIATSDLTRARETAEIIARVVGVESVAVDAALRERSFGVFEGLTRQECAVKFPEHWSRYQSDLRCTPPEAEPHEQVIARMQQAIRRAWQATSSGRGALLVVSHGGAMRIWLSAELGIVVPPVGNTALFKVAVMDDRFENLESLG